LIETPDWYLNRKTNATDILHEYVLPRSGARGFLDKADRILERHRADLLNTAVRDVAIAMGRPGCFFTGLDDRTYGVATTRPA